MMTDKPSGDFEINPKAIDDNIGWRSVISQHYYCALFLANWTFEGSALRQKRMLRSE